MSVLPKELTGQDFWKLSVELSEPDGFFRSDNLVSNELFMQQVVPDLTRIAKPGGVYLGVGPEQNFTYIAAVKPAMAFIIDVRRGNLHLHLMYKAIFELSADRAEFLSRLFSMKRQSGLDHQSTVREIIAAYGAPGLKSDELLRQNIAAIRDLLAKKLGLPGDDLEAIEGLYQVVLHARPRHPLRDQARQLRRLPDLRRVDGRHRSRLRPAGIPGVRGELHDRARPAAAQSDRAGRRQFCRVQSDSRGRTRT